MSSRRPSEEARGGLHPVAAGMALAVAVAGVLAAGAWGLAADRGHAAHDAAGPAGHAAAGHTGHAADAIAFPGGLVTVEGVADVDLSMPMAGPGMSMPPDSGLADVPKGYHLVDVDVTVWARAGGDLRFDAGWFRVQGQGAGPTRARPTDEARNLIPKGGSLSRTLTFQVPDAARDLELTVEGGDRSLKLEPGSGGHAGH